MSDSIPKVSIVIPHWNNVEILSECLKSIGSTIYPDFEVIVVDNASTDNSVQYVKSNFPDVKLIENDRNDGYAGGCNIGADLAQGKYLIFLNNDTIQNPNWISSLLSTMESNTQIAAVQPKILNYFDRKIFDYAGGSGGHMDVYCFPLARGRLFTHQENDEGQYDNKEKCFWSSGTCFMIRRKLFFEAGGFDNSFFAHMEEVDLCWKLQAMGYEVWVDPEATVYHKNGLTLPMYSHKKYYLNHRNSLLMLFGNYSLKNILLIGPVRLVFEIIAFFHSIIILDWKHATAIIRSLFWIISHPHVIIKKRACFSRIKKINDKTIMGSMIRTSVVLKYYIQNKKTYFGILSK